MASTGSRFGRYELRDLLGRGAFAEVFRARDPALGREVALKALLPHLSDDPDVRRRFRAEALALARLKHPNIVTVHDVGEAEGRPFFAMELVPGQSLDRWLAAGRPWPLAEAVAVVEAVAGALDALHAAGLVHRDVKPANVMWEPGGRVVLMDLGIARELEATQYTRTGTSLGTPSYMAPEQVRGEPAGPAADIYALGILAYHLLTGQPPFVGETVYVMHAHAYEPPPPLSRVRPDVPIAVETALAAALEKDPARRPASAGAFATALSAAASQPVAPTYRTTAIYDRMIDAPTVAALPRHTPPPSTPPASIKRSRTPLFAALGVAAVLVVAGVAGAVVLAGGGHGSQNTLTSKVGVPTATATPVGRAAASVTPVVTGTVATGSATARAGGQPSITATVTPAPPAIEVTGYRVENADGWVRGQGNLQGCFSFRNAPAGTAVRTRVTTADDRTSPVADGALTTLTTSTGGPICTNVAPTSVSGGNYVALLFDAGWKRLAEVAFVAQPPAPTPPPVGTTETIGVTADDPKCCAVTVDRVQLLTGGELSLSLSFVMHTPGWKSDNTAATKPGIYLVDEQGHRSNLLDVAGKSATDDPQATNVSGSYHFQAPTPGTRWVWLHYATDAKFDRALVIGIGLGATASPGTGSPAAVAGQRITASATGAGDNLLANDVRLGVVRAENLGGGTVRLLLGFTFTDPLKWTDDNKPENKSNVYLENSQGQRGALLDVSGPAATDDDAALTISGWYRFAPLPAGSRSVSLHYGGTVVSFDLGAAGP